MRNILALAALLASTSLQAQRTTIPLCEGWRFLRQPSNVTASTQDWEQVTLPHTWNAEDGQQSGKNRLDANGQAMTANKDAALVADPTTKYGYYRGAAWYAHTISVPPEWAGKRVFVRFEAASQVARVYINGQMLGEHRGAFTAFCYELTQFLKMGKDNELRLEVDNTHRMDLPPLSGDFNVNGGLYRPAELIVTDKTCISPLFYASPGIFLTAKNIRSDQAEVEVSAILNNGTRTAMSNQPYVAPDRIAVRTTITDAEGKQVASQQDSVCLDADTQKRVTQTLKVDSPHLWQGRKDPYLYRVRVALMRNGQEIDTMEQTLGLRTFAITEAEGFLLNGQPYHVYGVGRHQDLKGKAWALTDEDNERDYIIMEEMGATAIRFAHYPQSRSMHEIADRKGFLVWDEIPLVNEIHLDEGSKQNVRNMLLEMIYQLYNHPSVAWWGIYNEIENIYTPPSEAFLTELREAIRAIDTTSRFVVGASDHGGRPHNLIPEATCFNNYPGWYGGNFPKEEGYTGELSQFAHWIELRAKEIGMRTAISEYGAGGDASQHTEGEPRKPKPAHGGPFQPEEWLAYVHEEDWRVMKDNQNLWGTFLWAMFDFASCMRNEGSVPSVNTKGIVSQDRQVKKDPYYFYKANWNPAPMAYIASRRLTARTQSTTDIKVYSNCGRVTLKVNGKKVGTMAPDDVKVALFKNVSLRKGDNVIEVTGISTTGAKVTDKCNWTLL